MVQNLKATRLVQYIIKYKFKQFIKYWSWNFIRNVKCRREWSLIEILSKMCSYPSLSRWYKIVILTVWIPVCLSFLLTLCGSHISTDLHWAACTEGIQMLLVYKFCHCLGAGKLFFSQISRSWQNQVAINNKKLLLFFSALFISCRLIFIKSTQIHENGCGGRDRTRGSPRWHTTLSYVCIW